MISFWLLFQVKTKLFQRLKSEVSYQYQFRSHVCNITILEGPWKNYQYCGAFGSFSLPQDCSRPDSVFKFLPPGVYTVAKTLFYCSKYFLTLIAIKFSVTLSKLVGLVEPSHPALHCLFQQRN